MGEIFERKMPAAPLEFTGERMTSGSDGQIVIEHLHRYFLARDLCRGLNVVDVACGEGYGTALLAQTAQSVVGIDVSGKAIAHAHAAYAGSNCRYVQGEACQLPVGDNSVDLVVSFETIEHFYNHEEFLAEVRRILRPGGRFIVSSPDRDVYSRIDSPANPYHVRELSGEEFSALLRRSFKHVRFLAQRPLLGSALVAPGTGQTITFERRGSQRFERSGGLPRPVYWIAIASDRAVTDAPNSIYIETGEIDSVLAAAQAIKAENATLRARAEAAETAHAAAEIRLRQMVEQTNEDAQSYKLQPLRELEEVSRDQAPGPELRRASEQAESFWRQLSELEEVSRDHTARVSARETSLAEVRARENAATSHASPARDD